MSRVSLGWLLLSASIVLSDGARLAVVRPFSTAADIAALPTSFSTWETNLPCSESQTVPVDLMLVYSQSYDLNPAALAAAQSVEAEFNSSSMKWHSCFQKLFVHSANLTAAQDTYDKTVTKNKAVNWVNGPNEVFRYVLGNFVDQTWEMGTYNAFYYMELDSTPVRAAWLDQFVLEALPSEQFPNAAIRGSVYKGDSWDVFRSELPSDLLLHINGNGIYNPTHPWLHWLRKQFDADALTSNNSVPYDLRLAQLTLQAQAGASKDFADAWMENVPEGENPYRSDSILVGNYANTLLNSSFNGGEFVRHQPLFGKLENLNDSLVTLAVADYGGGGANRSTYLTTFNASLQSKHPFRQVIVVTWDESMKDVSYDVNSSGKNTMVSWKNATMSSHLAFCELANLVQTQYFVFTDTYHAINGPVDILTQNGTAVVPVLPINWCHNNKDCRAALNQSQELFGKKLYSHYDSQDVVFDTSMAKDFCGSWEAAVASRTGGDFDTCDVMLGPTADDYYAWMAASNMSVSNLETNRLSYGWRSWTVSVQLPPADTRECALFSPSEYVKAHDNMTASHCALLILQPDACMADPSCQWRAAFQKCIPLHEPKVVIFNFSVAYSGHVYQVSFPAHFQFSVTNAAAFCGDQVAVDAVVQLLFAQLTSNIQQYHPKLSGTPTCSASRRLDESRRLAAGAVSLTLTIVAQASQSSVGTLQAASSQSAAAVTASSINSAIVTAFQKAGTTNPYVVTKVSSAVGFPLQVETTTSTTMTTTTTTETTERKGASSSAFRRGDAEVRLLMAALCIAVFL